jgi:hypothetical protein
MARSPGKLAALVAAGALSMGAQSVSDDAYPRDITPPPGTQYPCALTALPRALPGIPEADRAYVNRTYAPHSRSPPSRSLGGTPRSLLRPGMPTAQPVPPAGLRRSRKDVRQALELQQG